MIRFIIIALVLCLSVLSGDSRKADAVGVFQSVAASGSSTSCVDGNDADTVLLIHSNTTDGSTTFVDSGLNAACPHAITVNGNVAHSTTYKFTGFGTSSIYFPGGAGDYLSIPDSASWDLGAGDFCVELKWNFGAAVNTFGLIGRYAGEAGNWGLYYDDVGHNLIWYHGNGVSYDFAWTPAINTPYHIAITRIGGTLRAFINGAQIGANQADGTNYNTDKALSVGSYRTDGASQANGYMTEVAIHVGDGVYAAGGFTPNTGAYCD